MPLETGVDRLTRLVSNPINLTMDSFLVIKFAILWQDQKSFITFSKTIHELTVNGWKHVSSSQLHNSLSSSTFLVLYKGIAMTQGKSYFSFAFSQGLSSNYVWLLLNYEATISTLGNSYASSLHVLYSKSLALSTMFFYL